MITYNFYHKGVAFSDIHILLRVYKTYGYTIENVLKDYLCLDTQEPKYMEIVSLVNNTYDAIKPYTEEEILGSFDNEEQRKVALQGLEESGKISRTYEYYCSTSTVWTSFDYGEVEATSYEEARVKAQKQLDEDYDKVNAALTLNPHTKGMTVECDTGQVEIKLKRNPS